MTDLAPDFTAINSPELCDALCHTEPVCSIRLNPDKLFDNQHTDRVEWCDTGFYLAQRPSFTLDPLFAAGAYYVQEASSMFVGWLTERLDLPSEPTVLDLCAAPGGKSTHLASLIGARGVLVANETIRSRAGILSHNIQKWGTGNVVVTSADAMAIGNLASLFDLVVVDAPCSGEGMFRKDETARQEWSLDNVEKCAARSRRIVADVWDSLRQGGYMIYSTCTFNSSENEQNALWIAETLGAEIVTFADIPDGIAVNPRAGYNFYPDKVRGEGFYAAVLRKNSPTPSLGGKASRRTTPQARVSDLYTTDPMIYTTLNGALYAYSPALAMMVERLRAARVFMLYAGVELGVEIRSELKPSHALALSPLMRGELYNMAELPLPEVQEYLRKGQLDASGLERGLNVITYRGLAVGFAKRIDGRVNNMLPVGWRIVNL